MVDEFGIWRDEGDILTFFYTAISAKCDQMTKIASGKSLSMGFIQRLTGGCSLHSLQHTRREDQFTAGEVAIRTSSGAGMRDRIQPIMAVIQRATHPRLHSTMPPIRPTTQSFKEMRKRGIQVAIACVRERVRLRSGKMRTPDNPVHVLITPGREKATQRNFEATQVSDRPTPLSGDLCWFLAKTGADQPATSTVDCSSRRTFSTCL